MSYTTHDQDLKQEVREALRSGTNIHEKVKAIILEALTQRQLDMDNIRNVTETVSASINEELNTQTNQAKEIFSHAVLAMDDALSVAAEASKLAIEEAASHVSDYSRQDFNRTAKDLADMEAMFLETLERAAKSGNRLFSEVAGDFIYHARQSGTKVGKEVLAALEIMGDLPAWSSNVAVSNTVFATRTLAQIGSGILAGIAESLQPSSRKK